MPGRDQARPGRSRRPRNLLEDVRADGGERPGIRLGPAGEVPEPMRSRRVSPETERPEAQLFSCPCCPATHSAEMMVAVDELAGPMIDDLPPDVAYICSWCDQHGRRVGKIDRTVP